jgi:hypothetical protein
MTNNHSDRIAPDAIAQAVSAAWGELLTKDRQEATATPRQNVWASQYRVCDRRMVYDLLGAPRLPLDADVYARMRRGQDRERDLLIDLQRVGRFADPQFEVIGQQEHFTLKDRKGRIAISGKVDARLELNGTRAPMEVKTWSPYVVDRLETFEDVFRNPWTRTGGFQLLAYLFGAGQPFGFLLLDRAGLPRVLPVELEPHLDKMEEFLARAERALDHRAAGTLPDFLEADADECRRCDYYGHTCQPPLAADVAQVLTDPELEAALARREELKAGIEQAIIGPFSITGKWSRSSRVELPPDLKKQYTVTTEKGRFTLEIARF